VGCYGCPNPLRHNPCFSSKQVWDAIGWIRCGVIGKDELDVIPREKDKLEFHVLDDTLENILDNN